jgi:hypothetical protein
LSPSDLRSGPKGPRQNGFVALAMTINYISLNCTHKH